MICPCGSSQSLELCCAPFIHGEKIPDTAEKLMRSRYTAFTTANITYLEKTLAPEARGDFDVKGTKEWAEKAEWKGLKIHSVKLGGPNDKKGEVEFTATYVLEGETIGHHEVSQFRKNDRGQWLFVDGDAHSHKGDGDHHHHHPHKPQTVIREEPKLGRNDPCHCGSGKKYKKCHGVA